MVLLLSASSGSTAAHAAPASRQQAERELAAAISGETAGIMTTHLRACARLDSSLAPRQISIAAARLSAERRQFPTVRNVWDEAFVRGRARARAENLDYDRARCAEALAFIRRAD